MMKSLLTKPVLISTAVQSTLSLLVAFGVGLTDEQIAAVLGFSAAATAVASAVLYGMEPKK